MDTIKRTYDLLEEHHMTLFELSSACDIPYTTIKMAERRGSQLRVDTIERICQALNITMGEFFTPQTVD